MRSSSRGGTLLAFFIGLAGLAGADEIPLPENPWLNDVKCLTLSPYYVTRNVAQTWWGYQKVQASFFTRETGVIDKPLQGLFGLPIGAVAVTPYALLEGATRGGVLPLLGHAGELLATPFKKSFRFVRLDAFDFLREADRYATTGSGLTGGSIPSN